MNKFDTNDYYQNSVIGLTLSAFLGTAALFFAGLLITQISSLNDSIRLPIVYLICCTVALVYSAIIYANMAGETLEHSDHKAKRSNYSANILSEFLGVNVFLISMPMVINAITDDLLLRTTVAVVILLSIFVYTMSSFSILSRVYGQFALVVSALLISSWGVILLYTQSNYTEKFVLVGLATLGLYSLWTLTLFFRRNNR